MNYLVQLFKKAEKTLGKLDKPTKKRLRDRLRELSQNPYDPRISKLIEMGAGERYSRVGDWRIIFEVDDATQAIYVVSVRHRREAYNNI